MVTLKCVGCGCNGTFNEGSVPEVFVCQTCVDKGGAPPPGNDLAARLAALERAHDELHKDHMALRQEVKRIKDRTAVYGRIG